MQVREGFIETTERNTMSCQQTGVSKIIIPGVTADSWDKLAQVCQQYPGVLYPSFGLHPCFLAQHQDADWQGLGEVCERNGAAAVGPQAASIAEFDLALHLALVRGQWDDDWHSDVFFEEERSVQLAFPVVLEKLKTKNQKQKLI